MCQGQVGLWVLSPDEVFFSCSQIDVYLAKSLAEKLYLFQVIIGHDDKAGKKQVMVGVETREVVARE